MFTGSDEGIEEGVRQPYAWSLPLVETRRPEVLLAYEMNGRPLEPQHGFPLRLVVPGMYGMASVKWLRKVTARIEPFDGPQHAAYRLVQTEDDVGEAIDRIAPRALMVPPGVPDDEGVRVVSPGPVELRGRAWSGVAAVEAVDVSVNGGRTWQPAQLDRGPDPFAWSGWRFTWSPEGPGLLDLRCRARDRAGEVQPDEPRWNLWGYANNAMQRIPVQVEG